MKGVEHPELAEGFRVQELNATGEKILKNGVQIHGRHQPDRRLREQGGITVSWPPTKTGPFHGSW
jgi:hypothetical protein